MWPKDISFSPCASIGFKRPLTCSGTLREPVMAGTDGARKCAPRSPTLAPALRSAAAMLTAAVDFPPPPLTHPISIVCLPPWSVPEDVGARAAARRELQAACRACHVCVGAGITPQANPTFSGAWGAPFFLVGQAPGPAERESRRPFSGRAGKELDRWMLRAGFASAEEFRRLTYIAALMRGFPGPNPSGTGRLRPPPVAVANCAQSLRAELA